VGAEVERGAHNEDQERMGSVLYCLRRKIGIQYYYSTVYWSLYSTMIVHW